MSVDIEELKRKAKWKEFPSGLPFYKFKDEYQRGIGNLRMPKEFFHEQYGHYCKEHSHARMETTWKR